MIYHNKYGILNMLISIEKDVVDERHHWDSVNQKKKREEFFQTFWNREIRIQTFVKKSI